MADWLKKAINPAHKGQLRKALGAKEGENIPRDKLVAASKREGKIGAQARLALKMRSFHKG